MEDAYDHEEPGAAAASVLDESMVLSRPELVLFALAFALSALLGTPLLAEIAGVG
ncbi:MAG TPA: hypothetical protein VHG51_12985 [Longimicrobiaceae bacterium]|nr:hypothetical protein [Longimicrobiaceae bacterium]